MAVGERHVRVVVNAFRLSSVAARCRENSDPIRLESRVVSRESPDMFRRAFSSLGARVRSSHRTGSLYLVGMGASAAGACFLYLAAERDARQREGLMREFDTMLATARVQAREDTESKKKELEGMQTLWTGTLTAVDHRLQGHLMLRGCRVGQQVDVLEEGVGQDGRYLTVMDRSTGAFGLHLIEWVERQ